MFGKRLRKIRIKRRYTQKHMAEIMHISLNTYQKYEQGEREPSMDKLVTIADLLDVSIDYLLSREDYLRKIGVEESIFKQWE